MILDSGTRYTPCFEIFFSDIYIFISEQRIEKANLCIIVCGGRKWKNVHKNSKCWNLETKGRDYLEVNFLYIGYGN